MITLQELAEVIQKHMNVSAGKIMQSKIGAATDYDPQTTSEPSYLSGVINVMLSHFIEHAQAGYTAPSQLTEKNCQELVRALAVKPQPSGAHVERASNGIQLYFDFEKYLKHDEFYIDFISLIGSHYQFDHNSA